VIQFANDLHGALETIAKDNGGVIEAWATPTQNEPGLKMTEILFHAGHREVRVHISEGRIDGGSATGVSIQETLSSKLQ
jgi:hypothetical protein